MRADNSLLVKRYVEMGHEKENPRERWKELEKAGIINEILFCSDFEIGHSDSDNQLTREALMHLSFRSGASRNFEALIKDMMKKYWPDCKERIAHYMETGLRSIDCRNSRLCPFRIIGP